MKKNEVLINGGALNAPVVSALAAEQFLTENYCFRRNLLNGKVEFATKQADGQASDYRPLTQEALNSIILRAKREDICEGSNPKTDIVEFIHSEEVCAYNPIGEYLDNLPQWDGQNHVAQLFSRLPGLSSEQLAFLSIWLRSTVAHWLQMDTLHGNEIVPTLIGAQGCGKTTFFKRLLPANLRQYFLDHLNLSNKFDKEMALTNNLLVCLDELEAIRPSQQASLKQTLSKSKVNGRPIYGCAQEDRARFASFVSTTNNPHPLSDATGSRRYICLQIPQGQYIDNAGEIDYDQLYAQVVYELREQKAPYWFNNDEVARIQQLNQEYMEQKDIVEIINLCFRKPEEGDAVQAMNSTELLRYMRNKYPSLPDNLSTRIRLGQAMSSLDFDSTSRGHVSYYRVALVKQETKTVKAA
ncbi:Virulence-associated protein E [Prevotella communis]|uniref:Virulence-associated protein E n=1 Tax=Prevotella communis TaxID=2913614 RepID=A0A1G7ZU97_9BACT|nr:VapE domain-containing protein [Prevotella communis]SDH12251.1 Virulence-associated protein E [Prevotella communis]